MSDTPHIYMTLREEEALNLANFLAAALGDTALTDRVFDKGADRRAARRAAKKIGWALEQVRTNQKLNRGATSVGAPELNRGAK